jgi:hypothetical protein
VEDEPRPSTPSEEREEPMSEGSASEDEQREVDDEGAIGVRTDFDPEEPIEDEPVDEVVIKVALNTLDELLLRVRRIEQHLGIADN